VMRSKVFSAKLTFL